MPNIGAGLAPAGFSLAGFGVPATASGSGGQVLTLLTAPGNGQTQGTGRFIHPVTKQYVFDVNGRFVGVGTVQQLVQLALTTVFGSSSDPLLGSTDSQIKDIGSDYAQQVGTRVEQALASLISQKLVQLIDVQVSPLPNGNVDGSNRLVRWRDLTTGIEQPTSF